MRVRVRDVAALLVALATVIALVGCAGGQGQTGGQNQSGEQTSTAQQGNQSLELSTVKQWAASGHARPITFAAEEDGCKNCHDGLMFSQTGGGFQPRMSVEASGSTGTTGSAGATGTAGSGSDAKRDWVVATDCRACHTGAGVQIAQDGSVSQIPNLDTAEGGRGALCMACHNGWHQAGAQNGELRAPHGSVQTDLFFGVNTMEVTAPESGNTTPPASLEESQSPHAKITDTCVGCHMQPSGAGNTPSHTFKVESFKGCQRNGCHKQDMTNGGKAKQDYDGDGSTELFTEEVDGMLATLKTQINTTAGSTSFESASGAVVFKGAKPKGDSPEYQAAYNYLFIMDDRSKGLHNPPYTIWLLQQSLAGVSGGQGATQ